VVSICIACGARRCSCRFCAAAARCGESLSIGHITVHLKCWFVSVCVYIYIYIYIYIYVKPMLIQCEKNHTRTNTELQATGSEGVTLECLRRPEWASDVAALADLRDKVAHCLPRMFVVAGHGGNGLCMRTSLRGRRVLPEAHVHRIAGPDHRKRSRCACAPRDSLLQAASSCNRFCAVLAPAGPRGPLISLE
jgi:hypothetical protein